MSDTISSSGIPLLTANNYADWSLKVSAAVMKKANIKVMLGTEPMPTLLADSSNAKQVREWQMDASVAAGYILESISPEARIHVTNEHDGPLMWSQLKGAYSRTSSASRIMHLDKLMAGVQGPDESISALIARLSECWTAFVNSQGTGFTLNELNEELFCWTLIHQLNATKYQDLHLTLIKDKALTKNSAISMATTIESGLIAVQPSDTAFYARSPGPSLASGVLPKVALIKPRPTHLTSALDSMPVLSISSPTSILLPSPSPSNLPMLSLKSLQAKQVHPTPSLPTQLTIFGSQTQVQRQI